LINTALLLGAGTKRLR